MQRNNFNRVEMLDLKTRKPFETSGANAEEILRRQSGEAEPRYILKSEYDQAAYAESVKSQAKDAATEAKDSELRTRAARNAVKDRDPEKVAAVVEALKVILADGVDKRPKDFTSKGEVKVSSLTEAVGFDVTATLRDAATEEIAKVE